MSDKIQNQVSDHDSTSVDIEKQDSLVNNQQDVTSEPELEQLPKSRGVQHIEAIKISMEDQKYGKLVTYLFGASVMICAWAYALDNSTTSNYDALATTAFNRHSMITALNIAVNIIGAVCKPFIAKIADLTSRPATYIVVLFFYTVGYIIVAASPTITAYIIGQSFVAVGGAGLSLLNSIVAADFTTLKWRGFIDAMLSTPFIINCWFAGLIVQDLEASNWRWGYGMFALIMPVAIAPAILIMLYLERRAVREGAVVVTKIEKGTRTKTYYEIIKNALIEIDAFGLLLLGFGFSLFLLPFSLEAYADGGWKNPSMIAMIVCGFIILCGFFVYEVWFCPFPCMPRRIVVNKTVIMAIVIDFFYMFAGDYYSLYMSSYAYVINDWSLKDWTYFNNTLTLSLCIFGVVAGIYMRITRRYKHLQIFGIAIKIIGIGLICKSGTEKPNTAELIFNRILVGAGGSFSVVGCHVAATAAVPHQDLGLVISVLKLWSSIGAAIGTAISAVIWDNKTPYYLRKYMPATVNDTRIQTMFETMTNLRYYPMGGPIRTAGIKAFVKTMYPQIAISLGLTFIPLICACFQTNYFLGDQLNAVEGEQPEVYPETLEHNKRFAKDGEKEEEKPTGVMDKVAAFFNKPLM